jgi:hypothetical protein
VTPDGVTIGGGVIWAARNQMGFKIARIIVPAPAAASRPKTEPIRVVFASRQYAAQYSGVLTRRDEAQSYLVRARVNQTLEATIDRFRGRDARLRVLDEKTGLPVAGREGPRLWVGRVTATGDYRIDVVRAAPDGEPPLIYVLAVTLR